MKKTVTQHKLGDMQLIYEISDKGTIGMSLVPRGCAHKMKDKPNSTIESLVQAKCLGDDFPYGFANGLTMRNSHDLNNLIYKEQKVNKAGNTTTIITYLGADDGRNAQHIVTYKAGQLGLRVKTIYSNEGVKPITLEMLSSFSISGLTPFEADEGTNTMLIHRLRSKWSNEGRLETRTVEELQLEPTWSRHGVFSEKFGSIGSMPVRDYFPYLGIEDRKHQVTWLAQIACPSSWQMEIYRRDDGLSISGGLADDDYGQWRKTLEIGRSLETPEAFITVCKGSIDEASRRMTSLQTSNNFMVTKDSTLPIIFNEFCTTWGEPSHENIRRICEIIKGKGFDYFVIDAGWYADPIKGWQSNMGDWEICEELFPNGLAETVAMIREAGLKPGIWFEMENCASSAVIYNKGQHLLKWHDHVITAGGRRFLDMRQSWTVDYLKEKVIDLLKQYNFEYVKIDYNESIGMGCDGAESLGEGLREHMLAAQGFYQLIKKEMPQVMIELCSSGGHRLEPSMLALSDIASFSDAHEEKEIPVIAANLHRCMLPRQSQIWAVLRASDDLQRVAYSIINTFLGVMCLSGDIYDLSETQWALVEKGMAFYKMASPIIIEGHTHYFGGHPESYRALTGWQGIVRYSEDQSEAIVIVHRFEMTGISAHLMPLEGDYHVVEIYGDKDYDFRMTEKGYHLTLDRNFEAVAIYLNKVKEDN